MTYASTTWRGRFALNRRIDQRARVLLVLGEAPEAQSEWAVKALAVRAGAHREAVEELLHEGLIILDAAGIRLPA